MGKEVAATYPWIRHVLSVVERSVGEGGGVGWTAPLAMETPCSLSLPLALSLGRPDLTSDATSPPFTAKEFVWL